MEIMLNDFGGSLNVLTPPRAKVGKSKSDISKDMLLATCHTVTLTRLEIDLETLKL